MSNVKNFDDLSPGMKFFVSNIFPAILVLVGLVIFLIYVPGLFRASGSKRWPSTKGIITKSEVGSTASDARNKGKFFPVVHYAFSVAGEKFTGDKVILDKDESQNTTRPNEIIKRYPIGKRVTIYYMSGNPEVSVLEPGIKIQMCYIPGIGLLFMFIGGVLAISMRKNIGRLYFTGKPFQD